MAVGPTYTDEHLARALATSTSWRGVLRALGLRGTSGAAIASVQRHSALLGLDIEHLGNRTRRRAQTTGGFDAPGALLKPTASHLRDAGSMLAASWFAMCGIAVSWPIEPARYDLLADMPGGLRRVQVKTTTVRVGDTWKVYLATSTGGRRVYEPVEIDLFFIVDGALNTYLIPLEAVRDLQAIHLSRYAKFLLRRAW